MRNLFIFLHQIKVYKSNEKMPKKVIGYSFEEMNLTGIYAYAHCGNDGSNKILKKLGLNLVGKFVDDLDGAECYWYELKKEDYK